MKVGEIWTDKQLPELQVEIVNLAEEEDYEVYSWVYETAEVVYYKFVKVDKENSLLMSKENKGTVFNKDRIHFLRQFKRIYENR